MCYIYIILIRVYVLIFNHKDISQLQVPVSSCMQKSADNYFVYVWETALTGERCLVTENWQMTELKRIQNIKVD